MEVLRTAILDKLRRKKGKSFSTSEVVQQMYPEDWELFLEDVNTTALELYREGLVSIIDANHPIDSNSIKSNSLQLSSPDKLK